MLNCLSIWRSISDRKHFKHFVFKFLSLPIFLNHVQEANLFVWPQTKITIRNRRLCILHVISHSTHLILWHVNQTFEIVTINVYVRKRKKLNKKKTLNCNKHCFYYQSSFSNNRFKIIYFQSKNAKHFYMRSSSIIIIKNRNKICSKIV